MKAHLLVWICVVGVAPPAIAQQVAAQDRTAIVTATKTIRPDALRAHMRFLSDSMLEGRAPDSPGYQIAARYVAAQLEAMGLRPGGLNGKWFQPVPLRKAVLDTSKSSLVLVANGPGANNKEQQLVDAKDYVLIADVTHAQNTLEAPIIFVGFGVTAPEANYDDYAGIDVR